MTRFDLFTELMLLGLSLQEKPSEKLLTFMGGDPAYKERLLREVYEFSTIQGLPSICFDGLQKVCANGMFRINESLNYDWFTTVLAAEMTYDAQQRTLSFLSSFYAAHGFDMMVLKGYGLCPYYPVPKHRPLGDIDIWLFGRREEADKILSEKLNIAVEEDKEHHTVFYINGIMVENHYEFVNASSNWANRLFNDELDRLGVVENSRMKVGNGEVVLPSPTFNALFLFRHMAQHYMGTGINFRQIADWVLFLKQDAAQVDWDLVLSLVEKTGCQPFYQALMGITCHYFGLSQAAIPSFERQELWEQKVIQDVCAENVYQMPSRGILDKLKRFKHRRSKIRLVLNENAVQTFIRTALLSLKYSLKK